MRSKLKIYKPQPTPEIRVREKPSFQRRRLVPKPAGINQKAATNLRGQEFELGPVGDGKFI